MRNALAKMLSQIQSTFVSIWRVISEKTVRAKLTRILLLISLILFAYSIARAYLVPFAHDESLTYLNAVDVPISDVLSLRFKDANNHPLNTWGMFVFSRLFGDSELSLRFPNLIAHLLYLLASIGLVRRIPSTIVAFTAFLVFNINPFLLEFFALARGYGLGLSFLMLSIWLTVESIETNGELRAFILGSSALAASTLAVLSNYTFIYYCVSLPVGLFLGRLLRARNKDSQLPNDIKPRTATLLLLVFAIWNFFLTMLTAGREIIALRRLGAFYVGGESGFWQDTVRSVLDRFLTHAISSPEGLIGKALETMVALVFILSGLLFVRLLRRRRFSRNQLALAMMVCVLFCTVALVIGAFFILDVNYPQGRSAIFLIPLIAIAFVFIMNEVSSLRIPARERINLTLAVIVSLVLFGNLLPSVNFQSTTVWSYDADSKRMLADLERLKDEELKTHSIRLGIDWWFEPTINFYRVTKDLSWLEPVDRSGLGDEYDYYYFSPSSSEQMKAQGVRTIYEYEITGNQLGKHE